MHLSRIGRVVVTESRGLRVNKEKLHADLFFAARVRIHVNTPKLHCVGT